MSEENVQYIKPEFDKRAFTCPHCNIVAKQVFFEVAVSDIPISDFERFITIKNALDSDKVHRKANVERGLCFHSEFKHIVISICDYCNNFCIWKVEDKELIFPLTFGPKPNSELPQDIIDDFNEARSVINLSPRASAALSRLILEKLLKYLNIEGENLNSMIGNLVKSGVDEELQQTMDALRVFGNEAVHPGVIDLKDDRDTAVALLDLINILAEDLISKKKKIKKLYKKIPPKKLKGIKHRDKKMKK